MGPMVFQIIRSACDQGQERWRRWGRGPKADGMRNVSVACHKAVVDSFACVLAGPGLEQIDKYFRICDPSLCYREISLCGMPGVKELPWNVGLATSITAAFHRGTRGDPSTLAV